ncbi:hypothetical protein JZ751_027548, partial [Albula glossodonta]
RSRTLAPRLSMVMGRRRERLALGFLSISTLLVMCMISDLLQDRTEILKPQKIRAGPVKMAKAPDRSYIGDTYASDDEVSQTHCTTGIRARVSKTKYKSAFIQSIPVLQWLKHVSKMEHERLRRYYGAFGWHSISFVNLAETLSALNTTANQFMFDDWDSRANGSTCIRCAVVGSGGILRGSMKGREIDEHHYVFRVNGAVIKGFEKDVGSRTTHYTFATNTMLKSMKHYRKAGFHGLPKSEETRFIFVPTEKQDYTFLKSAATQTKMFLRSRTMKTKFRTRYRPTTGALMLMAAVHTCDQVDAYGFITPDYKKYSCHYFDKGFHRLVPYINHDWKLEMKLWQELHKAGLIRLYMRK